MGGLSQILQDARGGEDHFPVARIHPAKDDEAGQLAESDPVDPSKDRIKREASSSNAGLILGHCRWQQADSHLRGRRRAASRNSRGLPGLLGFSDANLGNNVLDSPTLKGDDCLNGACVMPHFEEFEEIKEMAEYVVRKYGKGEN